MEDIAAAVSYLRGLQQVDGLHIGVIRESFGGLAMLNFIAQQPDLFAAAVDFYGPTDLSPGMGYPGCGLC
jgi:dienelactone hydrolase